MNSLNKPYTKLIKFENKSISNFDASFQLNHKKPDNTSLICMVDGCELFLCGMVSVLTPSGIIIYGSDVLNLIPSTINSTKDALISFLQGNQNHKFDGYHLQTHPYFEWQERDGESIGSIFFEIPSDISLLKSPNYF